MFEARKTAGQCRSLCNRVGRVEYSQVFMFPLLIEIVEERSPSISEIFDAVVVRPLNESDEVFRDVIRE